MFCLASYIDLIFQNFVYFLATFHIRMMTSRSCMQCHLLNIIFTGIHVEV